MLRYAYSVLLLAITKPACDHIIRIITKNTNTKVEDSTLAILAQLQKLKADLIHSHTEGEPTVEAIEKLEDALQEYDSLNKQVVTDIHKEIAELRKLVLEGHVATAHNDSLNKQVVTELRKLVLENCTTHDDSLSKQVVAGLHEDIAELRRLVLENRTAAHADAVCLHEEHVQIYNRPVLRGLSRAGSEASVK